MRHTKKKKTHVLVWGASSAVGALAVQLSNLAGCSVIGVASEKNADYVKSLGAAHFIDYTKQDVVAEVHKLVGDDLVYAVDTIGAATAQKVSEALSKTKPSVLATVAGGPANKPEKVTAEAVSFGSSFDSNAAFYADLYRAVQPLLENGKLQPLRVENIGGLENVPDGFQRMDDNKVSGVKLVATVQH